MDQNDVGGWLTLLLQVIALVVASVGALWAYLRYVLERGIFPPVQFDVEVVPVGPHADAKIIEVLLRLTNLGSSTLITHNVRVDLRYLRSDDDAPVFSGDSTDSKFGRVNFIHSLKRDILEESAASSTPSRPASSVVAQVGKGSGGTGVAQGRGFLLLRYDTFVQVGVTQTYTFVTKIPDTSRYILAWASFEYAQRPRSVQRIANRLGRRLGLIQFSLHHVKEPHTVERVFYVGPNHDKYLAQDDRE